MQVKHPKERSTAVSRLKVESMGDSDQQTEKEGKNPVAAYKAELVKLKLQLEGEIDKRKQAEESVQRLRLVLDSSADAVFLVDRESLKFVDVNETACNRLGYSREELLAMGPQDINQNLDRATLDAMMGRLIDSGETSWTFETLHVHKDGHALPVEINTRLIKSRGRLAFISIARDISARKRAEQEAIAQLKLAETFFNHSISCLVILDKDYNFIRVNKAYAHACQRDISEFAGRNHFEMYPSDAKLTFDEVVRTKRPYITFTQAFVFPDQPERGVTYWDWTLVPILDQAGEVEYLVFSLNDVTESKRAEAALRANERLLVDIFDALPALVSYVDAGERYRFVNKKYEEWFRRPRVGIVGRHVTDVLGEDAYQRIQPYVAQALSGRQVSYEEQLFFDEKGMRNIHAVYVPHITESGKIDGFLVVVNDMTEVKQAESRRMAQEKELRETLVREVHHRIKNNLQGVAGLMQQHVSRHPEIREWMEDAIGQIHSISIIHGLQSDTLRDEPRLGDMVCSIVQAARDLRKATVELLPGADVDETVRISKDEAIPVALVLNELIHNAIKHGSRTEAGVKIFMHIHQREASISICNQCDLSAPDFDFVSGSRLGTGLNLVKSMLPKRGARLDFMHDAGKMTAELVMAPPVILPPPGGER